MATTAKNTESNSTESFAALFEESIALQEMRSGEVITAEVISIDNDFVIVNAGLKSESVIKAEEFLNDQGELDVKVGDFVKVAIEKLEDGFGSTILSRDKAKKMQAWLDLEDAMNEGTVVKGFVSSRVKGGLRVSVNGITAFLPGSLVDVRPVKDTSPFENKEWDLKVIKIDKKRNNVVVSRKAVMEQSSGADRDAVIGTLTEGATVKGIIKNITDYGAFVDLGGIDGLLHITDLAWRRVKHPSEILNNLPNSISTPELQIKMNEGEPHALIKKLQTEAQFDNALEIIKVDGLRVEYQDGFGLMRASNTTPVMV